MATDTAAYFVARANPAPAPASSSHGARLLSRQATKPRNETSAKSSVNRSMYARVPRNAISGVAANPTAPASAPALKPVVRGRKQRAPRT
jgi:hypothetical protein